MTLPLGYPPTPKAKSKPKDPEEVASTSATGASLIFITVPFPYVLSNLSSVSFSAFNLSSLLFPILCRFEIYSIANLI